MKMKWTLFILPDFIIVIQSKSDRVYDSFVAHGDKQHINKSDFRALSQAHRYRDQMHNNNNEYIFINELISYFSLTPFISDAYAKLDTLERIANQNIYHAHRHHAKMEARAGKPVIIHMNASVHQVSTDTYLIQNTFMLIV